MSARDGGAAAEAQHQKHDREDEDQDAVEALRAAGVRFVEVSREGSVPGAAGAIAGERV